MADWTPPERMVACEEGPVVPDEAGNERVWSRLVGYQAIRIWGMWLDQPVYRPCDAEGRWV